MTLSPGYPVEMSYFTRGLSPRRVRPLIGVGDRPPHAVPEAARHAPAHYEHVSLSDEGAVLAALHGLAAARPGRPGGAPAGAVQAVRRPGSGSRSEPARDDRGADGAVPGQGGDEAPAGAPRASEPPGTFRATSVAQVWEAAEQIGYPLIVKPIAGAGSADTYRVDSARRVSTEALPMLRHVPEVSVEEFVDAEEFTHDTACANGRILFEHVLLAPPASAADAHARVGQPRRRSPSAT